MLKRKLSIALFHCGFIYSGGGERLIIEEAKGLINREHQVTIFVPILDKALCYPDHLKNLTVKTFLPQLPAWISARYALEMVFSALFAPFLAFRFKKFDIIIGANQPGAWIAFCVSKILNKPYIVYMNQPNRILYPRLIDEKVHWQNLKDFYFLDGLIKKMKFFIKWADFKSFTSGYKMLVNGEYIGNIIKRIYKKDFVTCPAGAYPQEFSKLRVNPHTAYNGQFDIANNNEKTFHIIKPYVLITNRHQPQKKFEYGIEAFKKVAAIYPDLKMIIPGPFTNETPFLLELIDKLKLADKVIFTGQISEESLQKLYREAVLYIYTAPEEDFGMGIIEAMGWGVPVVAWKHAGPTVTVRDGITGFLARPYDINDFAEKMIKAINTMSTRAEMGKQAWAHVRDNFSWDKHVGIMENVLYEALEYKGNFDNRTIE